MSMRLRMLNAPRPAAIAAAALLVIAHAPASGAALEVLPAATAPGGEIRALGEGVGGFEPVRLVLRSAAGGETELAAFDADADGDFSVDVGLGMDTDHGSYDVVLEVDGAAMDTHPLRVRPPPAITLDPASGVPGQPVGVEVTGLIPGNLEIRFNGSSVLGPAAVADGSFSGTFHVPLDSPRLGASEVRAINRVGRRTAGQATAGFDVDPPAVTELRLENVDVPTHTLVHGEKFTVSADLVIPDGTSIEDYAFSLVWKTVDGKVIPINQEEVETQGNTVIGEGAPPSLAAGALWGLYGEDDEVGFVYSNPETGKSRYVPGGGVDYDYEELQAFTVRVEDVFGDPIEDAFVTVDTNTQLLDFEEDDSPDGSPRQVATEGYWETSLEAKLQGPNQMTAAQNAVTGLEPQPESCPTTLFHGPTDANGEFQFQFQPGMIELFQAIANAANEVDINTNVPVPGNPKFTVKVNGLAEGYGPLNSLGKATVLRFDFMLDFADQMYYLRDGPDGEFNIPFNPNVPLEVTLPEFTGELEFPAKPFINGLHSEVVEENGAGVTHIKTLVSFPDPQVWPDGIINVTPAIVRLPFDELSFGVVSDMELYLDGQLQDTFQRNTEESCTGNDVEYRAEIPDAHRLAPGTHYGTIEGELKGNPISADFAVEVMAGPDWFTDNQTYENQIIFWEAAKPGILADEKPSDNDASVPMVPHVGSMDNDNASGATLSQAVGGAQGETSRNRMPASDANIANNSGGSTQGNASAPFGVQIDFGDPNDEITIVDTGAIPLFRYSWGFSPIIGATFGADFWLKVFYRYFGNVYVTLEAVLVDFTAEPAIQAGLDVFFELGALFGLISAKAIAQPSIGIGLPIVITDNQFDTEASTPCFEFLLNVLVQLSIVGIEEEFIANILDVSEPADCDVGALMAALPRSRQASPPDFNPAIAADGNGHAMTAWEDAGAGGIVTQAIEMGQPAASLQSVDTGPGAIKPDLAAYAPGRMLMVWSESELSQGDFDAMEPLDALPHQRMVYALNHGNGWGPVMPLTMASTGEGGPALAACPADDPACPAGGEVLAIWERDVAGDLAQNDIRLYYARFDGQSESWGPVQALHPGSTAKEVEPTATYAQGEPVALWVRNDAVVRRGSGAMLDLAENRIAYRWLDQTAGARVATGLPQGVANPSLSALSDGRLVAGYTYATETEAFIGTRRALHTAEGNCSAGVCTWVDQEQRTSDDRLIYAEGPAVVVDDQDNVTVQFRHLGYDTILPTDPPGVQMFTGDASEIEVVLGDGASDIQALSVDGAVNWKMDPVFDPAIGGVLSVGVKAPLPQLGRLGLPEAALAQRTHGVSTVRLGGASGPALHNVPRVPELEMVDARITELPTGGPGSGLVDIVLRNNGTPLPGGGPVTVAMAWDAAPGAAPAGGAAQLNVGSTGIEVPFTLELDPPPDYDTDEVHKLFVRVNPGQVIAESDGANNTLVLATGAMPVPQNLTSSVSSDSNLVYIHWDGIGDDRVAAYRIYRRNPGGEVIHVGTSDVPGFVDLSAVPGNLYEYAVASLSARAVESDRSAFVSAIARSNEHDFVFTDGFE